MILIRPPVGASVRKYWVYILRCSDASLYTGYTSDIERRVIQHNSGKASKYTRARLPVTIAYLEEVSGRSLALKRESKIKKLNRSSKLVLCSRSLQEPRPSSR